METAASLSYGLRDGGITSSVIWGARAIYKYDREHLKTKSKTHYLVDLLWDRQSFLGAKEDIESFKKKLNGTKSKPGALSKFIKMAYDAKLEIDNDTHFEVVIGEVKFTYRVDRWEGGYMYITAVTVQAAA